MSFSEHRVNPIKVHKNVIAHLLESMRSMRVPSLVAWHVK